MPRNLALPCVRPVCGRRRFRWPRRSPPCAGAAEAPTGSGCRRHRHWQWQLGVRPRTRPAARGPLRAKPARPEDLVPPRLPGGEYEADCDVPRGAFLVLTAGGWECSSLEPEPFFGANEAELLDSSTRASSCSATSGDIQRQDDHQSRPLRGDNDARHASSDNLLSPDAGLTLDKGYYLVISPLSPGTHTLRAYDEFESIDFQAGITFTINVN